MRLRNSIDGSFEQSYHPACMTELTLTAIFEEAEEGGYIGYVAELPGANTQGDSLEETRDNLNEAIQLVLNSNRKSLKKTFPVVRKWLARSSCCVQPDLFG